MRKVVPHKRRLPRAIASPLIACGVIVATFAITAGVAAAVEPHTPLGYGTRDFALGADTPDNQPFWEVYDPNSAAQVHFTFNTTPTLGFPTPIVGMGGAYSDGRIWIGAVPTEYTVSHDPPSISSPVGSVAWVPSEEAFHLVVHNGFMDADLWFRGPTGGAMLPAYWDAEQTFWTQSLGTGTVNGTIRFPGDVLSTPVVNWFGEQESQFGPFQIGNGPNPLAPPTHIGYDYNVAALPDGSTVVSYGLPEIDGVWRGILVETLPDGTVNECEPHVWTQSNWTTLAATLLTGVVADYGYEYPLTVSAHCDLPGGGELNYSFSTTPQQTIAVQNALDGFGASTTVGGTVTRDGVPVPGAKIAAQYIRQFAYEGQTP